MRDAWTKDKIILYLLIALAGGGGSAVQSMINPPRPDPFTGTQGRALHQSLNDLRNTVTELQAHDELLMKWYFDEIEAGRYDPNRGHTHENP